MSFAWPDTPIAAFRHPLCICPHVYRRSLKYQPGSQLLPLTIVSRYTAFEWYRTIRLLQLPGCLKLLLPCITYHFYSGCTLPQLSTLPRLATTSFVSLLSNTVYIVRIHLVRVGPPPPFSLTRSIRYTCSGCERCRPPMRNESNVHLSGLRPDIATNSMLDEHNHTPPLGRTC